MSKKIRNDDAAQYLGLHPQTLKTSRATGKLNNRPAPPYYKIGKNIFYDPDELDEYVADCRVVPKANVA